MALEQEEPYEYDSEEEEKFTTTRIILKVRFQNEDLTILIDSGSTGNYINHQTAERLQLPWKKKKKAYRLYHAEGKTFDYQEGWVTKRTDHLNLEIANRQTPVVCDIADIPKYDIILGMPWLGRYDPDTQWSKGQIHWRSNERTPEEKDTPGTVRPRTLLEPSEIPPQYHQRRDKSHSARIRKHVARIRRELAELNTSIEKAINWSKNNPEETRLAPIPRQYRKYKKLFKETLETGLPEHSEWDHEIVLKDGASPKFHKIYNLNETELKFLREWLDDQLKKGYIRVSTSSAGYPVMFVPKKNGKLRLVIDYRQLNEVTIKDRTPLPLITEIRDRLTKAQWFTALDLKGAYNLIRIKEGHEWKTAFRTRYGLFECLVMPFGLTNAPATFQRMINQVLREYIDQFVIVYLDDILIFSETLEEHEKHVHKDNPFKWEKEEREAFQQLKDAITSAPVLTMFDPTKQVEIETDASKYAIGGQLGQRDEEGRLHPIAFFSKKLSGPALRYSVYDQEFLGITEAFKEWRHYCIGSMHKVKVFTDHKNIAYFTTTQRLSGRQIRNFELLADFDYEIIHCKGSENGRADALSRKPELFQEVPEHFAQALQVNANGNLEQRRIDMMFRVEENNLMIDEIKEHVKNWTPQQFPAEITMDEGCPMLGNKIWVPDELHKEVVKEVHEHPLHGHKGITKTTQQVYQYYTFKGLKKTVANVVASCQTCGKTKDSRHRPYGKLQPLPVPERPWESVTMDHITDLPLSKEPLTGVKYDSIFVVVDRLTKQAYFLPHKKSHNAEELSYTYRRMIAANHGLPKEIISDRGPTFASKFWQELMAKLGTNHKLSTAYHPQTDGQTERTNQIIEHYLRAYINREMDDWVEKLPTAQLCYNCTKSESTGLTPFFANYGFTPEAYRPPRDGPNSEKARIQAELLKDLHEDMRTQLEFIRQRMKEHADKYRHGGPNLREGDMVYLLRHTRGHKMPNIRTDRPNDKLDYRKLGPFKIIDKIKEVNYRIELPDNMRIRYPVFHVSQLEKALVDEDTGEVIMDEIIVEDNEEEYEVESVLAIRQNPETQETEYLTETATLSAAETQATAAAAEEALAQHDAPQRQSAPSPRPSVALQSTHKELGNYIYDLEDKTHWEGGIVLRPNNGTG
ncbi:reverse transcriptase domain [Trichoderma arundinaceum]|uniref:Reverse transcriptase domain n=1 Tax=Trichoderma arundinaceum TaxID=490622 RepID=A0A395NN00_TRIAR|nr:reverse transcriptase domain [Trichoderma arundinaceum]